MRNSVYSKGKCEMTKCILGIKYMADDGLHPAKVFHCSLQFKTRLFS